MKLGLLIRENRWTAFMLICVVLFYSFLLIAGYWAREGRATAGPLKERADASQQWKQKEAAAQQKLLAQPALMNFLSLSILLALASGVFLDALFLNQKMEGRAWPAARLPAAEICWGLKDVFQALVLLFFVEGCLFLLQCLAAWATGWTASSDLVVLADSLVRDVCVTVFVVLLVRRRHGRPFSDLGLRLTRFFSFVRTGVLGYVGMVPPLAVTFMLLALLSKFFSYEPEPQNVVQMYLKAGSEPYLLTFTLFVAVLGPVLEEIFFRGFAYPALKNRFGIPAAAVFTAAVFAAFHMSLIAFFPIFLLGLFLCYLYESSGSLVPSISAHVLHNSLMVGLTLVFRSLSAS